MLGLRFLALGKNFSSQIQIALPGWYSVSSRPHWPVLLRPVTFLLQCLRKPPSLTGSQGCWQWLLEPAPRLTRTRCYVFRNFVNKLLLVYDLMSHVQNQGG